MIDLANVYSCSFLQTQDFGKAYDDGTFRIEGRITGSEIRGAICSYSERATAARMQMGSAFVPERGDGTCIRCDLAETRCPDRSIPYFRTVSPEAGERFVLRKFPRKKDGGRS